MKALKQKLGKKNGFTLIEMLIVVAIIAILIAISIPLINGALERSRDATDQANERAAKAEATLIYMNVATGTNSEGETVADLRTALTSGTTVCYYDAAKGELKTQAKADTIVKYGKCTCTQEKAAGKFSSDWNVVHQDGIICIRITPNTDTFTLFWVNDVGKDAYGS